MCRVNFLASRRLVSGFLTMMKPVRLHKSVWRKNECSCFCFRGGAIRRPESRRNSRAGVTSSRKDGPVRCRRAKAFFSWLQFAARKRISRPTFQNRKSRGVPGGELDSRSTPNAFGAALVLQIINRELWILLSLQHFFDTARLRERRGLLACDKFELFAQSFCCVCVLLIVLQISPIKQQVHPEIVCLGALRC